MSHALFSILEYRKDQNRLTKIPVLKLGFTGKGHEGTLWGALHHAGVWITCLYPPDKTG